MPQTRKPQVPKPRSPKRTYASSLRDEQARQTRRQIVAAAGRLYETQGFAATTVDAIAAEAGVSRKTVFTSVGGKVALLKLAYDFAMAQDDEPITMIDRPRLQEIIGAPDSYRAMELYADFVTQAGGRISALYLALRGAAEVDEEARELYDRWEHERRESMRAGPVSRLVGDGVLRPEVSPAEAADILWLLIMPSTYHALVVESGWSPERFRDWLLDAFRAQLLVPEG
jgi:TetR/AcrR family transcriptional regulator, regulator of autoinduction and epiphytic fitness